MGRVLDADLSEELRSGSLAIGVLEHGTRRIFTYGTAKPDSIFEIGSISKTFTGLLLAQMAAQREVSLYEPVRELLPAGTVSGPAHREITLLDLATHHSGLPRMPDNFQPADQTNPLADYGAPELYQFVSQHGLGKDAKPEFLYTNLGFALLGQALAERAKTGYRELLQHEIAGPLGMKDTTVRLTGEQTTALAAKGTMPLTGRCGRGIRKCSRRPAVSAPLRAIC
jgi:CubicO group peptidase (beta-lactamase class C family)